jgi:hypothetical protein
MPQPARLPVSLLLRCLAGAGGIAAAMLLYAAAAAQSRQAAQQASAPPKKPPAAPKRVHDAAAAFLATLRPEQRARATIAFDSDERFNWHFVPRARKGLAFGDMDDVQQAAALAPAAVQPQRDRLPEGDDDPGAGDRPARAGKRHERRVPQPRSLLPSPSSARPPRPASGAGATKGTTFR